MSTTCWDWDVRHPVIRLSFADDVLQSRAELDDKIRELLDYNQQRLGVRCDPYSFPDGFPK